MKTRGRSGRRDPRCSQTSDHRDGRREDPRPTHHVPVFAPNRGSPSAPPFPSGVSKRTLYERIGSKEGLILAAYDSLDLPVFRMLTAKVEAEHDEPRDQLDAFFAQLESILGSPEFRGCPFVNAASELPDPRHPAHEVVRRHKVRMRRWLRDRARAAGAAHPEELSRQLMLVFAGAQAQALVRGSGRPARDARKLAATLVENAIVATRA